MDCKINLDFWNGVFAVPNIVIDKYIKLASGVSVKVLLVLLRNSGNTLSSSYIASILSISEEEVKDAISFWQQMSILSQSEVSENMIIENVVKVDNSLINRKNGNIDDEIAIAKRNAAALRTPDFSPKEIAISLKSDQKMMYLFKTAESLYGRPLKHPEESAFVAIVDEIGLPSEVAMMMVQFCCKINKATPAYMKAVAMEWVNNGIVTIPMAEQKISQLENQFSAENRIKKIFEISRSLTQKEKEFSDCWINTWKFSDEMIRKAYEISVDNIQKLSMSYINKILNNWYINGVSNVDQVSQLQQNRKDQEITVSSSLDYDAIDASFLDDYD